MFHRSEFSRLTLVALNQHPSIEFASQFSFDICIFGIVRQVLPFVPIVGDCVQLLGRTMMVTPNLLGRIGATGFSLLDPRLERARLCASVCELHVRCEVQNVLELVGANRADSEVRRTIDDATRCHLAKDKLFVFGRFAR